MELISYYKGWEVLIRFSQFESTKICDTYFYEHTTSYYNSRIKYSTNSNISRK